MTSSLKKYQENPVNILNTAFQMYKSKKIKTAIVEGICDKRFLSQWQRKSSTIRFDGFAGKEVVEKCYRASQNKPYKEYDFLYLFADVDYDKITNKQLIEHPKFIYNAYCSDANKLHYNDLEIFLINSISLEKVIANYDIELDRIDFIRHNLESASRIIGSLRAADIQIQKSERLRASVLNGIEIEGFFDPINISINTTHLYSSLSHWSNYPTYIDDLISCADSINRQNTQKWALSRGHDVTEMLSLYLSKIKKINIPSDKLELSLRLACEFNTFIASPMGKQLTKNEIELFYEV